MNARKACMGLCVSKAWSCWSPDLAPGHVAARSSKRRQAKQSNSQLRSHMRGAAEWDWRSGPPHLLRSPWLSSRAQGLAACWKQEDSHENVLCSLGSGHSHRRLGLRHVGGCRAAVRPRVRPAACAPRFRWILAMLSILRGRDLRGTPGTRVAQAGWVVRAERVAEVSLDAPRSNLLMSNRSFFRSHQHGTKKMKPLWTTKKNLGATGLTLILASLAANDSWTRPPGPGTDAGRRHLVQYCVPQEDDGGIGQGIYCESGFDRVEAPAFTVTPERA
jgi:hypothetical protein